MTRGWRHADQLDRSVLVRAFAGRRALVTGAGGGIGRHLVQLLHDCGAQVLASDVTARALLGLPGVPVPMDVTSDASVTAGLSGVPPRADRQLCSFRTFHS